MEDDTARDAATSLDRLLETERDALLAGDLGSIPDLVDAKARLVETLAGSGGHCADRMQELHRKIERNQLLLSGALEGIRKVADRLATIRRVRHSLEFYDQQGRRRTIKGDTRGKLEKRA